MTDNVEQIDDETEKLLADLEAQEKAKVEPVVKKSSRKKSKKVDDQAPTLDPKPAASSSNVLTNTSKNTHRIKGQDVKVGDTYTLSGADLDDKRLMAKIDHAVKLGVLSRGAD